jgi:hypothetical protein
MITNLTNLSEPIDPDSTFTPNLVNTVVFLTSTTMQVSTFAINYKVSWKFPHQKGPPVYAKFIREQTT